MALPSPTDTLDTTAHLIQTALTPVFLLSGIGTLLNVFSTRLGRVADRVDRLSQQVEASDPRTRAALLVQLAYLRRRSYLLDAAVVLGALGGGSTCAAALALFVGALRNSGVDVALDLLFGSALFCTLAALAVFMAEMLLASQGLRVQVDSKPERASGRQAAAGRPDAPTSTS